MGKELGLILKQAHEVITGPRRDADGDPVVSFIPVAETWSHIFGTKITPHQVQLAMIALKLFRESNKHQRDNLVDICGYAALADVCINDTNDITDINDK